MPELAEVEYFRRRWDCGLGQKVLTLELHSRNRVFRGNSTEDLVNVLTGARLLESRAHGKQILFRFSRQGWLGVHLGMTGELRTETTTFMAGRHDHLVLRQKTQSLVFRDARQFGRVLFQHGGAEPIWWRHLPPALTGTNFTLEGMQTFLQRHARAPIKAVLLRQEGFPGVGNWMADEILWRAKIPPRTRAGMISDANAGKLWRAVKQVCAGALRIVANDYSDPPSSWLFRHRWEPGGRCPKDRQLLSRATIGGRTTAWCPKCQSR